MVTSQANGWVNVSTADGGSRKGRAFQLEVIGNAEDDEGGVAVKKKAAGTEEEKQVRGMDSPGSWCLQSHC